MNKCPSQNWMTVVYDSELNMIDIINPQQDLTLIFDNGSVPKHNISHLEETADESNKVAASIIARNVKNASDTNEMVYFEYINNHDDNTITYVVCFAEKAPDGLIYVNVIKVDEEDIVEARRDGGFSAYITDTVIDNLSVGVYMRHYSESGTSRYTQFNDVVKEFFESDDITKSKFWSQEEDDNNDKKVAPLKPPVKFEKVFRNENGGIIRWMVFNKKYVKSKASGYYITTTIVDITNRKHEEMKVEEQYAILDSMYKNLPVGVGVYSKKGEIISFNDKYLKIFGLENKAAIKEINYFNDPFYPESYIREMNKGKTIEFKVEYDFDKVGKRYMETSKKGKVMLLFKGTGVLGKEGNVESYLEIVEDISDKVAKEQELEVSRNNLKLAMSAGRVSAWQYDIKNDIFSTILGSTLSDYERSLETTGHMMHPDDFNQLKELIKDISSGQKKRGALVARCMIPPNTEYSYYESEMEGRTNEKGEVMLIVGTQHDITERGKTQIQLNNVRKSLDMVMDASNVLITDYNTLTKERRILYGHRLLNRRPSLQLDTYNIHPDDKEQYYSLKRRIINGEEESGSQEVRIMEEGGTYYYYENSLMGIKDASGKVSTIIGSLYDISEQRMKRIELERTQQYLQLALDASGSMIWLFDVESMIFSIIQEKSLVRQYCTYSEFFNYMMPEYVELMQGKINGVIYGSTSHSDGYYKIKPREGKKREWVHLHVQSIKENGEVKSVIMLSQNVTELIEQRDAIQKSAEELDLALKAGNVSAWIFDVASRKYSTLYGQTIAGEGISVEENQKLLHPDDVDKQIDILKNLLEQKVTSAETISRYRDSGVMGGYRYYENRLVSTVVNGEVVSVTGTQKDITENRLKQVELEEFKLKTNLINRSCNIVQWDYDPIAHLVYSSFFDDIHDRGFEITTYLLFVHPDDVDKFKELLFFVDRCAVDSINFDVRLKKQDSIEYRKVVIDGIAVKNKNGKITRYTGIRRDIHEITQLNERLIENNALNNLILDNINMCLLYMTPECVINWSNFHVFKNIVKKMGFKNYKSGEKCTFLVNGVCSQPEWCAMKPAIETKEIVTKVLHSDNNMVLNITAIPVIGNNGVVKGGLMKFVDITEKERIDKEISEAKEKAEKMKEEALLARKMLEEIIERMPGAIFMKDASNGFRYVDINNLYCKTVSMDKFEIIGKNDFELYDLETANKFYLHDIALAEGKKKVESYDAELSVNGKTVYWQISKSSILAADGKLLIIGIATDVSKLREINNALKEAQIQAEQADKLKSAFLANMSHEIRTPLNAIVGFSDLLMETDDQQEKEDYCKIITTNNELLLHLIGDILDLSKIEAGTIDYKEERFDLSDLFKELTFSLKQRLVNNNVEYIVNNPYKSCFVTCDKYRYAQIVTNFVTNAIKYTPSGYIKVGYIVENGGIKTYVTDTGIGVPADKRSKVFQRFEKLDTFAQGNGLGLSIVKAITESRGGKVGFESEEGKGSTFWSWRPYDKIEVIPILSDEVIVHDVSAGSNLKTCNAEKILIVEDDNSNYLLVKTMLKKKTLARAVNGIEAVKLASEGKYDVILMDFKMPVMGGMDATRKIREFDRETPIIALTAYAFSSDKEDALAVGCDAYLAKPIKKADLFAVIDKVMADKRK